MDPVLIVLGAVIGLIAVAPLGPVNIIVIKSSLQHGVRSGLWAGLGSVVGDGIFSSAAAFGVRWIEELVRNHSVPLQAICGLVLVVMGVRTARRRRLPPATLDEPLGFTKAFKTFVTTFILTILNPATLLGFLALFAAMSDFLRLGMGYMRPTVAVAGVMLGSFSWWLLLSLVAVRLRSKLSLGHLTLFNHWAGILIAAFGFLLLMHALL